VNVEVCITCFFHLLSFHPLWNIQFGCSHFVFNVVMFCQLFDGMYLGKSIIPIGANYFENVCACCCLPFVTIRTNGHYCYNCKNIVGVENQPYISYKIKQWNGDDCDYILFISRIKLVMFWSALKTSNRNKAFS
jgi:hypothetical protein